MRYPATARAGAPPRQSKSRASLSIPAPSVRDGVEASGGRRGAGAGARRIPPPNPPTTPAGAGRGRVERGRGAAGGRGVWGGEFVVAHRKMREQLLAGGGECLAYGGLIGQSTDFGIPRGENRLIGRKGVGTEVIHNAPRIPGLAAGTGRSDSGKDPK